MCVNSLGVVVILTQDGRYLVLEPGTPRKWLGEEIHHIQDAFSVTGQPTIDGAVVVDLPPGKAMSY